jgi:transcription elongation factor GreA
VKKFIPTIPVIPQIPFTGSAYQKLQLDFDRLTQERKEVMIRLQTAREMGDLSENGAYIYAKQELGSVNRQLAQLRHLLQNGVVVEKKNNTDTVEFGCTVTLKNNNPNAKEISYTIVSMHESNLAERKLSTDSPIGKAIMGKKVGDVITVTIPSGEVQYTIIEIR